MDYRLMSYLDEREYEDVGEKNEERLFYWNYIFGSELMERLQSTKKFQDYIYCKSFENKENFVFKEILKQSCLLNNEEKNRLRNRVNNNPHIFFESFFLPLAEVAIDELKKRVGKMGNFRQEVLIDFGECICKNLQPLCIRVLVANMHELKKMGLLKGGNKKAEYVFYCTKILGVSENREKLLDIFPALYRCICQAVQQKVDYFAEVIENFDKDIEKLCERKIIKRKCAVVKNIKANFSDTHKSGRQVVKLVLENNKSILYKPRSMTNEQIHSEILCWLGNNTGIAQRRYPILNMQTHSWCAVIEKKACKEEYELREYYRRLGAQLFLAYVLGTKDLHGENVIASGAYPVLVDLETLVNLPPRRKGDSAEAELYYQLSYSVLYTGLLPFYTWFKDGKGINISAISGGEEQVYPFKVPILENKGTSEMRIAYRHPRAERSNNLAFLKRKFKEPSLYEKELVEGFVKSYQVVLAHKKEFARIVNMLAITESRYLVADTQRYHMQLSASYHPDILHDSAEREIFLNCMWLGREWEDVKTKQIVCSEIQDMLQGDIPYFSCKLNQRCLFDSKKKTIKNYFEKTAIEEIRKKVEGLNKTDLRNQSELIRVALQLMPNKSGIIFNGVYGIEEKSNIKKITDWKKRAVLLKVTNMILDAAIYNRDGTDVSWYGIELVPYGRNGWEIKPMNMYFYSGIAGMAVTLHKVQKLDGRKEILHLVQILDKKLFSYTDNCKINRGKVQSGYTGMYEGEASIVYAYLCIYQIEQHEKYLKYAEMHSEIVERMLEYDGMHDLLFGNAGAARSFLLLYETTNKKKYLNMAKKATTYLEKAVIPQDSGIGWITEKGNRPLAGMAHGCSGISIPYAQLWKYTRREHYLKIVKEILSYENSLYDEETKNWKDVRSETNQNINEDKNGAVAWCHGAAGILQSRMLCLECVRGTMVEDIVKRDIKKAFEKVQKYPVRNSWSLCHGTCGNMLILQQCADENKVLELKRMLIDFMGGTQTTMLPQERVSFGMMNGWAGIAFTLTTLFDTI